MKENLFTGPNAAYLEQQYERYKEDPESVEHSLKLYFQQHPVSDHGSRNRAEKKIHKEIQEAQKRISNLRAYGHLFADLDPLHLGEASHTLRAEMEDQLELGEELDHLEPKDIWPDVPSTVTTAREAYQQLKHIYTHTLAYEFLHVHDQQEREWLYQKVERETGRQQYDQADQQKLLRRLIQVEMFEHFLQKTFVGQKRFSIEGLDTMVPMLDKLIELCLEKKVCNIMMGMSHRGRLNVLAHVLNKPYEAIFSEFQNAPNKDLVPSEGSMGLNEGWTGDVKYHLGASRKLDEKQTHTCTIRLANNPSHLEFVNPVVLGLTRAAQEDNVKPGVPEQNQDKAVSFIIHGDSAFPGEGIVSETLNLSNTEGYQTGGTIHIIANNRIGFTTEHLDARSTHYASDIAKGYEIPIVHVNADDPEACLSAIMLAFAYRSQFHKDFLIDLVGYRRFGHNEMDDPAATQPIRYTQIVKHPTASSQYEKTLLEAGVVDQDWVDKTKKEISTILEKSQEMMREQENGWDEVKEYPEIAESSWPKKKINTKVAMKKLQSYLQQSLDFPESFHAYPKLKRILERRKDMLKEGQKVDWATAELLAFASITSDGTPLRIAGQDTQRGTFGQRHLILFDQTSGERYCPLHHMKEASASFQIHNSPLSEAAVLGFEYGYNVHSKKSMVLWEAQYGDFVNAAQVIIDQFISAGRAKWGEQSSLIMLLPHGYEGQGPEHSSARLERFLQLCAEQNMVVAYPSTAAQYFHLLRRHAALIDQGEAIPMVVMTPKSLLRHERTASPGKQLSQGSFGTMLQSLEPKNRKSVVKLVCCSGKVAIDAEEYVAALDGQKRKEIEKKISLIRIEQLYPFPSDEMSDLVKGYSNLQEIVWLQEEPANMGAWIFIKERLYALAGKAKVHCSSRPRRSSPAGGNPKIHRKEQQELLEKAFDIDSSNEQKGADVR